ncbi:hypothetical protein [Streptomyces amakusaensis]|uniref:Novel STAND NTPase 1 domain-containing protein n=1 Tax=Streptomyces amakusaensis TaxID=67271 RepID=A0ABW0ASN9_9ACTN
MLPRTRRSAARDELVRSPESGRALERLVPARLLTVDNDTVDFAHEALIRGWPRLPHWADTDRERLRSAAAPRRRGHGLGCAGAGPGCALPRCATGGGAGGVHGAGGGARRGAPARSDQRWWRSAGSGTAGSGRRVQGTAPHGPGHDGAPWRPGRWTRYESDAARGLLTGGSGSSWARRCGRTRTICGPLPAPPAGCAC